MNFCRRCQSDYEKPGTCNCFAEGGDARPAPVQPIPYVPYVPSIPMPYVRPWWEPYPYQPVWISGTWSGDSVTIADGNSTSWVSLSNVGGQSSDNVLWCRA